MVYTTKMMKRKNDTWSQADTVPPKHMNRYPMATRHIQITSENTRRSFLNTDSMQTRMNMAKKMARAVGTVIKNATWSSTSSPSAKKTASRARQAPMTMSSRKTMRGCCWLMQ